MADDDRLTRLLLREGFANLPHHADGHFVVGLVFKGGDGTTIFLVAHDAGELNERPAIAVAQLEPGPVRANAFAGDLNFNSHGSAPGYRWNQRHLVVIFKL